MSRLLLLILATVAPVAAAALALGAYLAYGSVRIDYLDLIGSRFEAVAERTASDAEAALAVGLPLAGQVPLERLIQREQSIDPMIATIDVLAPDGTVLFSSAPQRAGTVTVVGEQDDRAAVARSVEIRNPFDGVEGRVTVSAAPGKINEALTRLAGDVRDITVLAALAAILLSAIAVAVSLRLAFRGLVAGPTPAQTPPEAARAVAAVDAFHDEIRRRLARTTGAPEGG